MTTPNDLVRRLATGQARGHRQGSFINELLTFRPVLFEIFSVPGTTGATSVLLGRSALSWQSWTNLRRRLVSVGFVIVLSKEASSVTMFFPESENS